MQLYEVVFYGDLAPNFAQETVQTNLASLFKIDINRAATMFSGKRIVIKTKLDVDTAEKYRLTMLKFGAVVLVEDIDNQPSGKFDNATIVAANAQADKLRTPPPNIANPSKVGIDTSKFAPLKVSPKDSYTKAFVDVKALDFGVAAAGSKLEQKTDTRKAPELDLSKFSVAAVGVDLEQSKKEESAPVPDTSHLSIV